MHGMDVIQFYNLQIQEDFAYLPRSAVAKYIELCSACSGRKKNTNQLINRS